MQQLYKYQLKERMGSVGLFRLVTRVLTKCDTLFFQSSCLGLFLLCFLVPHTTETAVNI